MGSEKNTNVRYYRTGLHKDLALILCDGSHPKVLSREMIRSDVFLKAHYGCCVNRW